MNAELLDFGAQAERTALAWQRTGIGAMAAGMLSIRGHVLQHLLPTWPGLLLIAAAGIAVLFLVPWRHRIVLRAIRAERTPLSRGMVQGTTVTLVIVTIGIGLEMLLS